MLRAHALALQEATGAVQELRNQVDRLESRVAEVECQLEYDANAGDDDEGVVRMYEGQTPRDEAEPDPTSRWWTQPEGEEPAPHYSDIPRREPDLASTATFGGPGNQVRTEPDQSLVVRAPPQVVPNSVAGLQSAPSPVADVRPSEGGAKNPGASYHIPQIQGLRRDAPTPTPAPDSDVIRRLAGPQLSYIAPSAPTDVGRENLVGLYGSAYTQPPVNSCDLPIIPSDFRMSADPLPGLIDGSASFQTISPAELNMMLKIIESMIKELPKLAPGDVATRAHRFNRWKSDVAQMVSNAGPHLVA